MLGPNQTRSTFCHRLIVRDTIDVRVMELADKKLEHMAMLERDQLSPTAMNAPSPEAMLENERDAMQLLFRQLVQQHYGRDVMM